ncbi:MAG TPA: TIM barrel protein [Vicinamibacterales bacterium]|nr:TIM barrel protein [Vicinamibacterales bacterium]
MIRRREFLKSTALAGAGLAAASQAVPIEAMARAAPAPQRRFKLNYAPHFGMFRDHAGGNDVVAELEFMASEGFIGLEDNGMRGRPVAEQEKIGSTLARLKMRMGVFVAHTINWTAPTLTSPNAQHRETFLKEVTESVEIAKRVGATWMTVVPGHVDSRPHFDYQTARVIETLKRAAAILEPHQLVMVLEPLNTLRNHPGMFLTTIPQAYMICKAVGSPSCKILFDIYHQQITEGNLIPNLDTAWDEVAYIQVGDNPGRNEPGTGEINYRNVFRHIHGKGFTGIVGMEHGNSTRGRAGERAVIDAYVAADGF